MSKSGWKERYMRLIEQFEREHPGSIVVGVREEPLHVWGPHSIGFIRLGEAGIMKKIGIFKEEPSADGRGWRRYFPLEAEDGSIFELDYGTMSDLLHGERIKEVRFIVRDIRKEAGRLEGWLAYATRVAIADLEDVALKSRPSQRSIDAGISRLRGLVATIEDLRSRDGRDRLTAARAALHTTEQAARETLGTLQGRRSPQSAIKRAARIVHVLGEAADPVIQTNSGLDGKVEAVLHEAEVLLSTHSSPTSGPRL